MRSAMLVLSLLAARPAVLLRNIFGELCPDTGDNLALRGRSKRVALYSQTPWAALSFLTGYVCAGW